MKKYYLLSHVNVEIYKHEFINYFLIIKDLQIQK